MKNPFLVQFHEDLSARYPVDGAHVAYADWIAKNTKRGGRPFGYKGFEFQCEIVNDMSQDLSVIKPSQVGLTEVQIRKFLAMLARNRGTSGIFTFPDLKLFKKNSKTRIRPVVQQPAFQAGWGDEKPQMAMELYEVNGSWAHIMGMTEGDATSTPADWLFHDEVDLSDQAMIGLYQSRLQNSDWKITQKFSTPTFPGYGIDGSYQASDQRLYMTRCRCSHWCAPTFTMPFLHLPGYRGDGKLDELDADGVGAIDLDNAYVKCDRCSQPLNLLDALLREWVATHPARLGRGYKVSPFSPTHGKLNIRYILMQLLKMKQLDNLKGWYNTVLGETHSDGNSKLEPDMVRAVMKGPGVPDIASGTPVALGLDMGKTCHLTLGVVGRNAVSPFLFEQVPVSNIHDRIAQLDKQYRIVCGGVDRDPYTPDADRIRDVTQRRVMPIHYRGSSTFNLKYDEFDNLDHIQVNRTQVIDAQVAAVRTKATEFRGYGGLETVVVEHLCDMVRIEVEEQPARWEKLTGNDHFMHSLALMRASIKAAELVALETPIAPQVSTLLVGVSPKQKTQGLGQPSTQYAQRII